MFVKATGFHQRRAALRGGRYDGRGARPDTAFCAHWSASRGIDLGRRFLSQLAAPVPLGRPFRQQ